MTEKKEGTEKTEINNNSKDRKLFYYKLSTSILAAIVLMFGGFFVGKFTAEAQSNEKIEYLQERLMQDNNYYPPYILEDDPFRGHSNNGLNSDDYLTMP